MNRPVALDPDLNLRIYTAGAVASASAASRKMGPPELGPRTVLFDGISAEEYAVLSAAARREGLPVCWSSPQLRLGGAAEQLLDLSRGLPGTLSRVSRQLGAAVAAFEEQLSRPARTLVMGILNVTPDSFSDGGTWLDPAQAVDHALRMVADGADIIDIGGESTRPGADEIPVDEELRRVLPVITALRRQTNALLSIDTRKAPVAREALAAGVDWVNDVSGMTHDPSLGAVVAEFPEASLVLMHSRARPSSERYSTAYAADAAPVYEDVVSDTLRWLRIQVGRAVEAGISPGRIWIDPGFGFGKTFQQNVELLRRLREYTSTGLPVLIGTSRKSSVGKLLGDLPADQRLEGTAATVAFAVSQGAGAVRVHDVQAMARITRVADALR